MKPIIIVISGIFLLASLGLIVERWDTGAAQWASPGELSEPHQELEGITNCFKCHAVTQGIDESSCRNCHKTQKKKLKDNEGFHLKIQASCVECHPEHKGKDFNISLLDEEKFDHNLTGYDLTGKHMTTCDKCHSKENRYLGTSDACVSCHNDIHRKTLSETCKNCHDFESWKNITFDHNSDSAYVLRGKHTVLPCDSCHLPLPPAKNDDQGTGPESLRYKPLSFSRCDDCHNDIHTGELKGRLCSECHTVNDWKPVVFDHNDPEKSEYRIAGKHLNVSCKGCHPEKEGVMRKDGNNIEIQTLQLSPIKNGSCNDCHYDIHRGQLENRRCDSCHSVNNDWREHTFSHGSTRYKGFKLTGKHEDARCDLCHERSDTVYTEFGIEKRTADARYRPLKSEACSDCHYDIHRGEFKDRACDSCHTVERPWKEYTFIHEADRGSGYLIEGKHVGVTCEKCHAGVELTYTEFNKPEKRVTPLFRNLKSKGDCIDCHKEEHKERFVGIAEVRDITCNACHSVEDDWKAFGYQHKSELKFKKYQLNYKAEINECEKCHSCGTEVFCSYCCVRRCMPCDFRQKILKSKDRNLYQFKNREP